MLKSLTIENIILVDHTHIHFETGFHVLSGETGSGKSAILEAIRLIMGERSDSSLIRTGYEKGIVEALFEIDSLNEVAMLLESGGITHHMDDELIIRREINVKNKSRAFINCQQVQLSFLRQVGIQLLDIVSQHATHQLMDHSHHLYLLDLFGDLQPQSKAFASSWQKEKQLKISYQQLLSEEAKRLREIETLKKEINEIAQANIQEGEEEELFAEYSRLMHGEELAKGTEQILEALESQPHGVASQLKRQHHTFQILTQKDTSLQEAESSLGHLLLEAEEIIYTLRSYLETLECNPYRSQELNDRLRLISNLKRKYENPLTYLQSATERLHALENCDIEIEQLHQELKNLSEQNEQMALILNRKRQQAAYDLEITMNNQLHSLNMPDAKFHVHHTIKDRSKDGDDKISFFLSPNKGEKQIPIAEFASGGELSRILLSLRTLLSSKEKTPTLIFDEIDANIGGETASKVGEKLKNLGNHHQVLCITHFPQVAKKADHHYQIFKTEDKGRTITKITYLPDQDREKELARMLGTRE